MKKIVSESYQEVENFLRSTELFRGIVEEFGSEFYEDSFAVSQFVVDRLVDQYDEDGAQVELVVICKSVDEEVDIVEQDHSVVAFNGNYYDYCAQQFNDSFNQLINSGNIPVVQKIIRSDSQINDKLSTVKGYAILGY